MAHTSAHNLRHWLLAHEDGGAAPAYVLAAAGLASLMVLVPYRLLIEFTITAIAGPTLLFLAAFVALRLSQPNLPRSEISPVTPLRLIFPRLQHYH